MDGSINHRNSRLLQGLSLGIIFVLIGPRVFIVGQRPAEPTMLSDSFQSSDQWKAHEASAMLALQEASECITTSMRTPDGGCKPAELLRKAAEEYGQMELFFTGRSGHVQDAVIVANGFVRSGAPVRAIEFLMKRPETATDSSLSHLLADALFAIGDYQNAALAYRTWINTGCGGYLYSMQSHAVWIVPRKADRCSHLPEAMRSRLESLQDTTHGEPANLPEHNHPTGNFVEH